MTANIAFASDGSTTITQVGLYVKVGALPSSPVALLDLDGAALGYFRISWQGATGPLGGAMGIYAEYSYGGTHCIAFLSGAPENIAGAWIWVGCNFGGYSGGGGCIFGQVWGPGGVTEGPQLQTMAAGSPGTGMAIPVNIGWGVNLSGTADDFPNAAGYAMDVLMGVTGTGWHTGADGRGILPPPTADPDPGMLDLAFLYLCHQPIGPADTITDSGPHGYHLSAGPQGARIVADGPY